MQAAQRASGTRARSTSRTTARSPTPASAQLPPMASSRGAPTRVGPTGAPMAAAPEPSTTRADRESATGRAAGTARPMAAPAPAIAAPTAPTLPDARCRSEPPADAPRSPAQSASNPGTSGAPDARIRVSATTQGVADMAPNATIARKSARDVRARTVRCDRLDAAKSTTAANAVRPTRGSYPQDRPTRMATAHNRARVGRSNAWMLRASAARNKTRTRRGSADGRSLSLPCGFENRRQRRDGGYKRSHRARRSTR